MADIQYTLVVKDDGTPVLKKFSGSIDEADRKVGLLSGGLKSARGALNSFGSMGTAVAVGAMVAFAKQTFSVMDAQKKFAEQVGISVRSVAGLDYAAKLSGSSAENMEKSMVKLGKAMADTGKNSQVFEALGIATKDAEGNLRGVDEVVFDVADRFANMQDGAEKSTLAMKMFGKTGAELIPTLNQGSEALRRQAEEGANLAGVNDDVAASMEGFNDSLDQITQGAMGLVSYIVSTAGPVIERFSAGISQWAKDLSERAKQSQIIAEQEKNGAKAQLLIDMQSLAIQRQRIKEGAQATNEQQTALRNKQKQIEADIESLGINAKEAEYMRERALLAAKQKVASELGRDADVEANKLRVGKLAEELKLIEEQGKQKQKNARQALAESEDEKGPKVEDIAAKKEKELAEILDRRFKAEQYVMAFKEARTQEIADNEKKYAEQNRIDDEREFARTQMIYDFKMARELEYAELKRQQEEESRIAREQELADRMDSMNAVAGMAGNLNQAISNYNAMQINQLRSKYEEEKDAIRRTAEEEANRAGITADRKAAIQKNANDQITALDKKQAEESRAIQKKTFEIQKNLNTLEATMNGAVAFTKALGAAPPPFNFALAASVAAITATQVALIQSQKFVTGGDPIGRNAIVQMNEDGKRESILNSTATQTLGANAVQSLNMGASIEQAMASINSASRAVYTTIQLTGFISDPIIADRIVSVVNSRLRRSR